MGTYYNRQIVLNGNFSLEADQFNPDTCPFVIIKKGTITHLSKYKTYEAYIMKNKNQFFFFMKPNDPKDHYWYVGWHTFFSSEEKMMEYIVARNHVFSQAISEDDHGNIY